MALYPYTLQPIDLNLTEQEFQDAQMALFNKTNQAFGLSAIKTKEWIGLAIVTILAIAGLVFVNGYSTILFWLMLIGVVLYLVIRTLGLKWYVQKEFEKQMAEQHLPEEMKNLKMGVQKHGLVISIPVTHTHKIPQQMRGIQMQAAPTQQAVIPWSAVTSWDETENYLFILFELKGQKGSQIIPKRMQKNKFPIETVISHLKEKMPAGIQADGLAS